MNCWYCEKPITGKKYRWFNGGDEAIGHKRCVIRYMVSLELEEVVE
jgi:hypothetical protein